MAVKLLVVCFVSVFSSCYCVLPAYLPALQNGGNDRDSFIEQYFKLGLDYSEILTFLLLVHGIQLSLRQLKRILARRGLRRRHYQSNASCIVSAVEQELRRSGSSLGYRQMHQRLRIDYGIVASKETIRRVLSFLDPEGVSLRLQHRLRRRQYLAKGPNYVWHIDGYDKLKPFGFCIHGAIDGFSRRIIWLEVGPSNNNPRVIATYFLDSVKQLGGTPYRCRSDAGTENVHVAAMQRFFRRNSNDEFAREKSFQYGRSTSNQRIEGWWAYLRRSETNWWMNYFKDLRDQGIFDETNPLHVECLKFCYMPLLRDELHGVAKHWNLHKIRPSTNGHSPHGRPDTIYFVPEAYGTTSYLQMVSQDDTDVAHDVCCEIPRDDFTEAFQELAQMIIRENNFHSRDSGNVFQTECLYIDLLSILENIV